jgi:putative ABC transport system permease protein
LFSLALRNVQRNARRLLPLFIILSLSFVLSFLLNNVFDYIDYEYGTGYRSALSGDVSLSPPSDFDFTLFGAELLLVGDFVIPPTFDYMEEIINTLDELDTIADYTFQVTSLAQVKTGEASTNAVLFGVDFQDYFAFFPGIELIESVGDLGGIESGIFLQEQMARRLGGGEPLTIGDRVLLTSGYGSDFSIREVPVMGIVRYPIADNMTELIGLIDADTARSLNGYTSPADWTLELSDDQEILLGGSVEDLLNFGGSEEAADEGGSVFASLGSFLDTDQNEASSKQSEERDVTSSDELDTLELPGIGDEWNFILLRSREDISDVRIEDELHSLGLPGDLLVKNWQDTVGGNVTLVSLLKSIVNVGFLVLIGGVAAVTLNAVMISLMERKREIGTIRAVGGKRTFLIQLIGIEVALVFLSAMVIGLLIGGASSLALNALGYIPSNDYIRSLFGGGAIVARLSIAGILRQLALASVIYLAALFFPLRKILSFTPLQALS